MRFWIVCASLLLCAQNTQAADWPQWRHGAARGAVSPEAIPTDLHLHWSRELPAPRPAWPEVPGQIQFDDSWQPVVAGQRLFLGSNVDDRVIAYDTRTGRELWSFHTDGPVRFAPAVWKDRVFAVSDDGFLYCLAAEDGKLLWKFRGGPADRRILGNERLVSSWPARGGPVVAANLEPSTFDHRPSTGAATVYFSAGIWPSMGIFVHAIDAETGTVKWTNDTTGSIWMNHPHSGAVSFGSICPQGYLAVAGKHVIVPGGRTMPAIFDRETGELVRFDFGRGGSGTAVMAADDFFIARGTVFHPKTGADLNLSDISLMSRDHLIVPGHSSTPILARSASGRIVEETYTDRRGAEQKRLKYQTEKAWEIPGSEGDKPLAMAGNLVIAERGNRVRMWNAKPEKDAKPQAAWEHEFESPVRTAIAADDRLFVVTDDSKLHCFAAGMAEPAAHRSEFAPYVADDEWNVHVDALLKSAGTKDGYAIVAGADSSSLIDKLLFRSKLHLIALDPEQKKIDALRERTVRENWYGRRLVAHVGDFDTINLPPYFASLIVAESSPFDSGVPGAKSLARMFESLRPYGGTLAMRLTDDERAAFAKVVDEAQLANAQLSREGEWTLLRRVGSLPGAGEWTHQYADAANSVVSKDKLVKAPLGVLWFGGPTNEAILPRHGHGPSPQVAGGRLVIEGPDMLRAVDVYTGRVFWERELPGLGAYYDTTSHFAGAGEIGGNYVTRADHVYVVHGKSLLELDAATGETTREFLFDPKQAKEDEQPFWGFLAVSGDLLIATAAPIQAVESIPSHVKRAGPGRFAAESGTLVVFDRITGERLWSREAQHGFRHNAIAAANGKLFCIDGLTEEKLAALARRGVKPEGESQLLALDARTGKELWSTREDVFGTFLNYSAEHDVLLQAGSSYRDRAKDEVGRGMVAYRGGDGHVLWKDLSLSHGGPCLLWKDRIITNGAGGFALELLTGEKTGWSYRRTYGCNTAIGSENLLTFRSGAAGYCDLASDSGTGNIGGFKSGCTSSLIVADGVFNAPDYTRTCSCAYQHQSSLALVHMPEGDSWTFTAARQLDSARVGINLGAPGDRRAPDGTLWVEYPATGGPSPSLSIAVSPKDVRWFARHSSNFAGDGLPWVAASGVEGAVVIETELPGEATGTVRLHFAEPEDLKPGERVFAVRLQGRTVLDRFDIVQAAGAPRTAVVREFPDVTVAGGLRIDLAPANGSRPPILCGIEFVPEED
ncbi:MAG: PQQ-binding-like beta-propeller repeat protein [Planctomycetales bacterium]